MPQVFFRSQFLHCLHLNYLPVFFPEQCSTFRSLLKPNLLTFKSPGFKSHWMQVLKKFSSSSFTSKWLCGNIFLLHSFACSSFSYLCAKICEISFFFNCEISISVPKLWKLDLCPWGLGIRITWSSSFFLFFLLKYRCLVMPWSYHLVVNLSVVWRLVVNLW